MGSECTGAIFTCQTSALSLLQNHPVLVHPRHHSACSEVATGTGSSSLLLQHFLQLKKGGGVTGLDRMRSRDENSTQSHLLFASIDSDSIDEDFVLSRHVLVLINTKYAQKTFFEDNFRAFTLKLLIHREVVHVECPAGGITAFSVFMP